jgi:hypothetical protein
MTESNSFIGMACEPKLACMPVELQEQILIHSLPQSHDLYHLYAISDVNIRLHNVMYGIVRRELERSECRRATLREQWFRADIHLTYLDHVDPSALSKAAWNQFNVDYEKASNEEAAIFYQLRDLEKNIRALRHWNAAPEYKRWRHFVRRRPLIAVAILLLGVIAFTVSRCEGLGFWCRVVPCIVAMMLDMVGLMASLA